VTQSGNENLRDTSEGQKLLHYSHDDGDGGGGGGGDGDDDDENPLAFEERNDMIEEL
jgi:hypothetical protein